MNNQPVTIVVTHLVKTNKEKQFKEWLEGISKEALKFPGHMGINIIQPSNKDNLEYVVIYRFNNYLNLRNWEKSPERAEWSKKLVSLTKTKPKIKKFSGIEYWFSLPENPLKQPPPRYKMAIVTWLAIFPLSTLLQKYVAIFLVDLPNIFITMTIAAIMISLMTYLVMPFMTRLFSFWLFKKN